MEPCTIVSNKPRREGAGKLAFFTGLPALLDALPGRSRSDEECSTLRNLNYMSGTKKVQGISRKHAAAERSGISVT